MIILLTVGIVILPMIVMTVMIAKSAVGIYVPIVEPVILNVKNAQEE